MTRRRGLLGAVVILVGLVAAGSAAAQQVGDFDFVDATDFPTVRLVVTPPDTLQSEAISDVVVLQDGVERPSGVFPLLTEPVEMVLLIDSSGSMAGAPIASARAAATAFVESLPTGSDISVIAFGTEVAVVAGPEATRAEQVAAIGQITATGETALFDAVMVATEAVARSTRTRQFIVVLSDGADTASGSDLSEVVAELGQTRLGFYAIALAGSEQDPAALEAMAAAAQGVVVPVSDSSGLEAIYTEIASEVVSQYAVVFTAATGGESRVEVILDLGTGVVRFGADLVFPAAPGADPATVVTIPPAAERVLTPPATSVVPAPGRFEGEWALMAGIVLTGLLMILVFAAVIEPRERSARIDLVPRGFGGEQSEGRPRRRFLRRAERGVGMVLGTKRRRGIEAALEAAGVSLSAAEYLMIVTVAALIGLGLGLLAGSPLFGFLAVTGAILLPRTLVTNAATRRRAAFADQLEGTLQLIAGSMRAGYGLAQAFSTVAAEAPSPTAEEFGRIVVEIRVGRNMTSSLRAAAERMRNDDFAWVSDAISIQQEVGGNLAEVLDAVGSTIRDRNQIRRQIRTLSAEGRVSAVVLIGLPFVAAAGLSVVNPGYLDPMISSTTGRVVLVFGIILMAIGIAWIRRIVKIVF